MDDYEDKKIRDISIEEDASASPPVNKGDDSAKEGAGSDELGTMDFEVPSEQPNPALKEQAVVKPRVHPYQHHEAHRKVSHHTTAEASHPLHRQPIHEARRKKSSSWLTIAAMIILLAILAYNQFQIFSLSSEISQKIADAKEAARPAAIQLAVIKDNACTDCFQIDAVVAGVNNSNANITEFKTLNYNSDEAKALIQKYQLNAVPAVVITGEVNKTPQQGFSGKMDALVFSQPSPPYRDLKQGRVVGRVSITLLNATNCSKCTDFGPMILQMKMSGISITDEKTVDASSAEGRDLTGKYQITKVPTILLSEDISYYTSIQQSLGQLGSLETDGTYVLRQVNLPYVDMESGRVKGLARLVMLNDSSCRECYIVTDHLLALKGSGVMLESYRAVDVSDAEGRELVKKYNITAVPTILLSNMQDYESFKNLWKTFGSIEGDGTYIFRHFNEWPGHAYKNPVNGTVDLNTPSQQAQV